MKNILVAIDFSDSTVTVINQAIALAEVTSAQVWLIHVAAPEPDFIGYQTGPQTERDFMAHQYRDEHRQLQKWAEQLREKEIHVTALLVQGATIETILEKAQSLDVDMIVVGSHGKTGLYKLLVGSVSEGIIKGSHCPVLIVPSKSYS